MNQPLKREIGEREAGISFSVAAIAPVFLTFLFLAVAQAISPDYESQGWYTLGLYLCSQLTFLAVIIGIGGVTKARPRDFGYRRCSVKFYLIGVLIVYGMLFGASIFATLFEDLMRDLGYTLSGAEVPLDTPVYFIFSLIVVGIIPGILEETLFRGVIVGGMRNFPAWLAVVLSGALFALFHQNPAQTVYQFLFGCVFALMTIKAGSILPAVAMHVLNNVAVIVYGYLGVQTSGTADTVLLITGLAAVAAGIALLLFCRTPARETEREAPPRYGSFFAYAAIGILYCAVMWALVLVQK